ncbi:MAG: SAM-dependent methyltransferase [Nitrospirota bacterium]
MTSLKQKIFEKIKKQGMITFETFMEMALYEPCIGYYASDKIEIGRSGDFYTSQHVHPIFGMMIGKQIEEMWEILDRPVNFYIVEVGAGEGYMCKDMMNYLSTREVFNFLTYIIVELSPFMKQRQEKLLEGGLDKIKWVSSLKEVNNIKGCILSNELLDSFPVHLIEMEDELKEIYIKVDGNNFLEIKGHPSTDALINYLREFSIELPKGYRTEINLRIKEWLRSVDKALTEGFILTIDYGYPAWDYYSEDRNRGTLLCYYKHQMIEDPYQNIGEQDITAHVNFSSVKKWAEDLSIKTIGFCNQGAYLVSLGIDEIIQNLEKDSSNYLFEIAKIKRLILPGTLGETHKVMIQYKGKGTPELRGFSIKNRAGKL